MYRVCCMSIYEYNDINNINKNCIETVSVKLVGIPIMKIFCSYQ